jgi:hypothetical protein
VEEEAMQTLEHSDTDMPEDHSEIVKMVSLEFKVR